MGWNARLSATANRQISVLKYVDRDLPIFQTGLSYATFAEK